MFQFVNSNDPPNPFDKTGQTGLTPDDISKIVDAAKQIRTAGKSIDEVIWFVSAGRRLFTL
jgi:hypothetical protein